MSAQPEMTRRQKNVARYADVNAIMRRAPTMTREEAARAVRKLWAHFAKRRRPHYKAADVRPVWLRQGWGRLVHDVSHDVFEHIYPTRRPHDPLHLQYEQDVAAYVIEKRWHEGALKPKQRAPKPPPSEYEKRAAELDKVAAAIKRWESKAKRAANALKKLRRKQVRLSKKLTETHAEEVDTLLLKL